jgi:hypothetical protein
VPGAAVAPDEPRPAAPNAQSARPSASNDTVAALPSAAGSVR